jgi:hypothetical protein
MEQRININNLQELFDWINDTNLCYVVENDDEYFIIEAPNNADQHIWFEKNDDIDVIICKTITELENFDADNRFAELWSVDFANHNHFTPSQFIKMLKEDEETFRNLAWKLRTVWQEQ